MDTNCLEDLARTLLTTIGEDPTRPGLVETPRRFAKWWQEFIEYDPGTLGTTFASVVTDQLVVVRGIEVWSLCEHHLLPFHATVAMGYVTGDKLLGLSKFARVAHRRAHGLQVQERLTEEIAGDLMELCGTASVGVVVEGVHLCMTMRGIKSPATMVTSALHGVLRSKPEARAEFLALAGPRKN